MFARSAQKSSDSPALGKIFGYYAMVFVLTHGLVGVYLLNGGSWSRPDAFVVANLAMLVPG